jgi:hypothetical protein
MLFIAEEDKKWNGTRSEVSDDAQRFVLYRGREVQLQAAYEVRDELGLRHELEDLQHDDRERLSLQRRVQYLRV